MKCDCDWCPNIPDNWKQVRIKDIAILKSGDTFTANEMSDDGEGYPVYGGNGLRGYTDKYNKNGDYVLIGRQGALCGNINYAHGKFFATEHALVVNTLKDQNTTWLGETLRCANYNRLSQSAAQPGLAASVLMNQFIPFPPQNIRERIGIYLDDKTAKIDRAVSLLQKKRDAYTRLKSSIINRAVTRGLNPNVKLKNSGVDWIGMIPENWDVKRIKNLYDYITRGATPKYVDYSNFKVMNQATFSKGFIDKDKIRYSNGMDSYARIRKGDLLIASTGGGVLGKLLYFKENEPDNFYADTHVTIIRSSNNTNSAKFLYYALYTKYDMINQTMVKGSTNQTELQRNYLLNYQIPIPSLTEQCAIADYLDIHCVNIDHAIFIVDKQIDAYTRLKKSLINEVVTGKRKV